MQADAGKTTADVSDLSDLEPLCRRLNAATDDLNQALQTFQDKLNALAPGVEVWVDNPALDQSDWQELSDDRTGLSTGERQFRSTELGYGRLGDGWALLIRTRRFVQSAGNYGQTEILAHEDNPLARRPLLRAARDLRIKAVELIPRLFGEVKRSAVEAIDKIENAKKLADSLK